MDEDKRDPFAGIGWRAEIVSLAEPHILFNSSLKGGLSGTKQSCDDYDMTPFL